MTQNSLDKVGGLDSKFVKIALTLVSMVLLFAGPTYVPLLLAKVIGVEYFASIGLGAGLFVVGLVLLVYLIRKKIVE